MTGKLLMKLDTVKFIVANHTVIPLLFVSFSLFTLAIAFDALPIALCVV